MSTVFVGEAHPPQGDPDNMFTVQQSRARRKSRRTGRGHRLQDTVAGLTSRDLTPARARRTARRQDVDKTSKQEKNDPRRTHDIADLQPEIQSPHARDQGAAALGRLPGGVALHHPGARRDADPDRHGRSAHRRLCRAGRQRGDGRQARRRADQRQGRHSRPPGRIAGRGFRQRRRHRRAEGAQADRARSASTS